MSQSLNLILHWKELEELIRKSKMNLFGSVFLSWNKNKNQGEQQITVVLVNYVLRIIVEAVQNVDSWLQYQPKCHWKRWDKFNTPKWSVQKCMYSIVIISYLYIKKCSGAVCLLVNHMKTAGPIGLNCCMKMANKPVEDKSIFPLWCFTFFKMVSF